MTLQWTVIALVLYAEIAVVLLLLLPWVRPSLWKKLFNSRFVQRIKRFSLVYSYAAVAVLLLLFFDATREVRKYTHIEISGDLGGGAHRADTDTMLHMRLFRAQRNLYISGFALLLALVINRIVGLLARAAHLEASAEAAMRQAENASNAARNLMEDDDGSSQEWETEKKSLLKKLKSAEDDRDAMRSQAKNLQLEYDRVCDQLNSHEKSSGSRDGGKKKD